MDERTQRVSVVYRITDGADDDWVSFYANWLIDHSELPETLGHAPTRSHLVHELVESERAFAETAPAARWHAFDADRRPLRLTVRTARCASTRATNGVRTARRSSRQGKVRGGWLPSRGHADAEASSGSRGPLEPLDPRESGKVG
jgi:hypothetical protein